MAPRTTTGTQVDAVMIGSMLRNMARALRRDAGTRPSEAASDPSLTDQYGLLAATLDNLDQGIVMYGPDLRVMAWNQAWARLRGFDEAFLETRPDVGGIMRRLGESGYFAEGNSGTEARVAYWTGLMATATRPFLAEQVLADGRILEVWTNPVPGVGYVATVTDVTERRRSERARAEQKEIIEATLENVDQAIVMFDRDRRVAAWNMHYAEMFHLEPDFLDDRPTLEEVFRRQVESGEWGVPEGGVEARVRHWVDKTLSDLARSSTGRFERRRPDGTVIEARTNRLADGGFVTAFADLTQQRRVEDAIRAAKEAAEAANQAKSVFLATMSHEIRTPMNGVIGMLELLGRSRLDADQREMVSTVRESAAALLGIIDDILDLSKIEAGRMTIEAVPVSVSSLVEGVAETLAPGARGKGLDLVLLIDPDIPEGALGDPTRLRQVLFNLAGNAVKFTSKGCVVIAAEITGRAPGNVAVSFRVSDTGIGIPADRIETVFEPFAQAEGSTTRRFGGTGLGLSIARHLIELMGGEIGVESEPGKGSTFWFRVPFALPSDAKPHGIVDAVHRLRVLVAVGDDEERRSLVARLAAAGADAVDAATEAAAGAFDVALVPEGGESLGRRARATVVIRKRAPEEEGTPAAEPIVTRPIRRQALLGAIAAAAGRARPEAAPQASAAGRAPSVEEAHREDRLILVVDDHPINRKVLQRQLEELGYAAETAEDGNRALALWRERRHVLVMTDCQMPGMDGYDLTMAIRYAEIDGERRTAIVGVSASVMASDVEKSLMSGMDEFVTKPVSLVRLGEVLARALPNLGAESATTATDGEPAAIEAKGAAIDMALLERIGRNDPDVLRELLAEFRDVTRDTVAAIESATAVGDAYEAGALAHRLVGAAATAGAHELAEAGRRVEAAGDAGDMDAVRRHLHALRVAMVRLIDEIAAGRRV